MTKYRKKLDISRCVLAAHMLPEWLLGMLAGAVGSTLAWVLLGPMMSGKGLERWVMSARKGMEPGSSERDKSRLETLYALFDLLLKYAAEREIKTGEKIRVPTDKKDAEGKPIYKEIDEIITPAELIARKISTYVLAKFKGSAGGTKAALGRILQDEAAGSVGLSPAALQALNKGRLGPVIAELVAPAVQDRLKKSGSNKTHGGEGGNEW